MEAYVDAERIDGAVAYAYAEVCGDVSGNFLAVSIFADSLVQLCVELILQTQHSLLHSLVGKYCSRCSLCLGSCLLSGQTSLSELSGQNLSHLRREVGGKVTDTRHEVHRLVLQTHTGLEFVLG